VFLKDISSTPAKKVPRQPGVLSVCASTILHGY
jgi:hypothetical protein